MTSETTAPRPDTILRRARVFGSAGETDIAISGGRIVDIGISLAPCHREIDLGGAYVSAAWIDVHVHLSSPATPGGVDALAYGPAQGVGGLIDAGTAAPARVGDVFGVAPWVYALANIDSHGIRRPRGAEPELSGAAADAALGRFPERVRGIKVQASQSVLGGRALEAIGAAQRVAEKHAVPIMVHVGNPPPDLSSVCDLLRPGDVITHYAHGKPEGATLAGGTPLPALRRAVERGVLLDVGHGRSSFAFSRCRALLENGIAPAIISTDLHPTSAQAPVVSLARTMSKLLALGLPVEDVIAAVTVGPAQAFGLSSYGPIAVGAPARLTAFVLEDREVDVEDSTGQRLTCRRWFQPRGCFLDDVWYPATTPV